MNTLEIHTFEAATMPEALAKVRKELGRNAVILQTRQHTKRGLRGLKTNSVEIIATPATEASEKLLRPTVPPMEEADDDLSDVQEMIAHLSALVDDLYQHRPAEADPRLEAWRQRLLDAETPREIVEECLRELTAAEAADEGKSREAVRRILRNRVWCDGASSDDERMIAFVGPPGAGKTTTIAKLAALAHFEGKRVLMVSTDMHRIGAVEQARTFSEIIGTEFAAPTSPEQLRHLLNRKEQFDLTLVDTDSQSRADKQTLAMRQQLVDAGCACYLVVDVNLRASSLHGAMIRYAPLQYKRVILTKLDEVEHPLGLVGAALRLDKPLKYVSMGPRVPDDLRPADPDWLVDFGLCLLD